MDKSHFVPAALSCALVCLMSAVMAAAQADDVERQRKADDRQRQRKRRLSQRSTETGRKDKRRKTDYENWWMQYVANQSPTLFRRSHRMPLAYVEELANKICAHIKKQQRRKYKVNKYLIRVKLACTLRFLGGSMTYDLQSIFQVGQSTIYRYITEITVLIPATMPMPPFPIGDPRALAELEMGFAKRSVANGKPGLLRGCCGAIDGILVRIVKPTELHPICKGACNVNRLLGCCNCDLKGDARCSKAFYCRKNYHALNVLAVSDAHTRFVYVDLSNPGSRNDSRAWKECSLYQMLNKSAPKNIWLVGDAAFQSSSFCFVPFKGSFLDRARDALNFYLSSIRITVERSFGILQNRWGVFSRALHCDVETAQSYILCAMILHNFIVDKKLLENALIDPLPPVQLTTRKVSHYVCHSASGDGYEVSEFPAFDDQECDENEQQMDDIWTVNENSIIGKETVRQRYIKIFEQDESLRRPRRPRELSKKNNRVFIDECLGFARCQRCLKSLTICECSGQAYDHPVNF